MMDERYSAFIHHPSSLLNLTCQPLEIREHLVTIACDQREKSVLSNHSALRSWDGVQQPEAECPSR
jgi:hypothetical protein